MVALILIRAQQSGRWRQEKDEIVTNHHNISRQHATPSPSPSSSPPQHPNHAEFVFINDDEMDSKISQMSDKGLPASIEYNGEVWFVGEVRTLGDVHRILWKTDNKDVVMDIQNRKPVPHDWTQR